MFPFQILVHASPSPAQLHPYEAYTPSLHLSLVLFEDPRIYEGKFKISCFNFKTRRLYSMFDAMS